MTALLAFCGNLPFYVILSPMLERVKIFIDLFKVFLLAFLTALFSMLAYLVINLAKLEIWQINAIFAGIVLDLAFIIALAIFLGKELQTLRSLK